MAEQTQSNNTPGDKLRSIVGFDPTKSLRITSDALAEVVKEINEERQKVAKGRAKELLTKAISLEEQKEKAKRDFNSACAKFDKELKKVVGSIQGILDGRAPQQDNGEAENNEAE